MHAISARCFGSSRSIASIINKIPASAFTNDEKRPRVAALIRPIQQLGPGPPDCSQKAGRPIPTTMTTTTTRPTQTMTTATIGQSVDDNQDCTTTQDTSPDDEELDLKISPESTPSLKRSHERSHRKRSRPVIISCFQRSGRNDVVRYALGRIYPFAGEIFPLKDIDRNVHQDIWLPLFAAGSLDLYAARPWRELS